MDEVIKKEMLYDLTRSIEILSAKNFSELEPLSDHAIEDVAVHKDLDLISVTVLVYSLYKIQRCLVEKDYREMITELKMARSYLEKNNFHSYNKSIKRLFELIKKCNAPIKEHMQDVMDAARIKKGAVLLQKGLSMGQADTRGFNRFMLAGAADVEIDSLGRVLIPDFLKDFAHLKSKVVLIGVNDHLEIWDEKGWDTYKKRIEKQADKLAQKLGELGVI